MAESKRSKGKELARIMYMSGQTITDISESIEVSRVTVTKWCKEGMWNQQRTAMSVTRPELVNKILEAISTLLNEATELKTAKEMSGFCDQLIKLSAAATKLDDKKTDIVSTVDICIAFGRWIEARMSMDKEVTPELVKLINKYQNLYLNERFNMNRS